MSVTITSISGLNTIRNLSLIKRSLSRTMRRLSSGERINRASDGPAELTISEQMRAQIGSLTQSVRNLEQNINKNEAADSAVGQLRERLQSMRELALAASNQATPGSKETDAYQDQINRDVESFNQMRDSAVYNGHKLLDGSQGSVINVDVLNAFDISDPAEAADALARIEQAIKDIDRAQVLIGSRTRHEYESAVRSLEVSSQNLVAAESIIRDTDYATSQADYIRQMIQLNAGLAAMAQGNLVGESVFKLLHA